jgi:serine/threonine-protein kinase HipA
MLTPEEATKIIDDMERTVKNRWYEVARRVGVSEQDCARLAGAFAYEGFRLALGEQAAS